MSRSMPTMTPKRDKFQRCVELFRCTLAIAGFVLSFLVEALLIRPHLPLVWSAGDWTLFVLGWAPLVAAAVVSALYVPGLSFFCEHCGKHISTKEPWICGYCKRDNRAYSFLLRCRTCGKAPKALRCPWCHRLLFLGAERDEANHARCISEERPQSDLPSIVRHVEGRASNLRLKSAMEGSKLQMLVFLDPTGTAAELRWFARPIVSEPLTVEGYQGNKHLFRQTGWEGSHELVCPSGEHFVRLLVVPENSTTKVEDIACRLVVSPPNDKPSAPPADPVAAAIAELEQLTLAPLALDEWAIRKESELRERWSKDMTLDEVNGLVARFRSSTKIARNRMEK